MHVVITSRILPFHSIGGMQVITWDIAKEFVKKGIRVTCVTTSIRGITGNFTKDGIDVVPLASTKPGVYSRRWWLLSKNYVEEHFANDCDVLLSVSASGYNVVKLKPKMKNTVFVFQGHGTSLSEIVSKLKLRTIKSLISIIKNIRWVMIDLIKYQYFHGIVAAGERVYRDFEIPFYRYFLHKKQIMYIPNGIDLNIFKPSADRRLKLRTELNIKSTDYVVLIASRLHKQKGIEQAVRSYHKYQSLHQSSHLIVLGDGPEAGNIKNLIEELGISNNTHIRSAVSLNNLPQYLNVADVFLFPTLHEEGLPLLPLEALACGLPVVASMHLKEIIEASEAVIPVNPRSIDSIVEGIILSKNISANLISLLPSQYSLEKCADQYLAFFKSLKEIT